MARRYAAAAGTISGSMWMARRKGGTCRSSKTPAQAEDLREPGHLPRVAADLAVASCAVQVRGGGRQRHE